MQVAYPLPEVSFTVHRNLITASPMTLAAAARKKKSTSSGLDIPGKSGLPPVRKTEANRPTIDTQNASASTFCLRSWRVIGDLFEVATCAFYRADGTQIDRFVNNNGLTVHCVDLLARVRELSPCRPTGHLSDISYSFIEPDL
ncbi:hypothetical protein PJL15_02630 [Paenarthrobacter nitroguajacolicus]|nr:hypothetical protein [Paenarthrobacter nitroguajacolicus]